MFGQVLGWNLTKCVSRDEFALEDGYVTFEGDKINYHPEKTYTADEIFDLDEQYGQILKSFQEVGQIPIEDPGKHYGVFICDTLDELLAHNSTIYERAK